MRWLIGSLVVVVIAAVLYVSSAVTALTGLVNAVRAHDGQSVLQRTDVPALRRSLAEQVTHAYTAQLAANRRLRPLELSLAAGATMAVADAVLSDMLTPEHLTELLQGNFVVSGARLPTVQGLPKLSDVQTADIRSVLERLSIVNLTQIRIRISQTDEPSQDSAIRLKFEGLGWKLAGLDLPPDAVDKFVAALPK